MRIYQKHTIKNSIAFKKQLLKWAQQYNVVAWLDSNTSKQKYSNYDAVLAVEAYTSLQTNYFNSFSKLKTYQKETKDWLFGYLTYDLKNDVENLQSNNFDGLAFPELYFFQPKKIFLLKGNQLEIHYLKPFEDEIAQDFLAIKTINIALQKHKIQPVKIRLRTTKDEYFYKINQVLSHINRGNIYEVNFCQEFYAEKTIINPLETYNKLNTISKTPFAAFLKVNSNYALCASPERYIKKEAQKIISQPIKGTAKRDNDAVLDNLLKTSLITDQKERSENIMIVDLVRNDLSQTAKKGSVKVEELCKVYSFDQVHQMISTVVSKSTKNPIDVLKTTFPMGSMTGAPKVSAMQIIETLENTKRGLYSGAIGYITPNNDFDFNVVIRSILYNEDKKYVSYSVGGAITAKSNPLKEYEECLIKAKAMREVLEN